MAKNWPVKSRTPCPLAKWSAMGDTHKQEIYSESSVSICGAADCTDRRRPDLYGAPYIYRGRRRRTLRYAPGARRHHVRHNHERWRVRRGYRVLLGRHYVDHLVLVWGLPWRRPQPDERPGCWTRWPAVWHHNVRGR